MSFKRCDETDVQEVLDAFSTLANPPHYPGRSLLEMHLENFDNSCWREEGTDRLCNVALTKDPGAVVQWLFPRAAWGADNLSQLTPVLSKAIVDFAERHPAAEEDDWVIRASFMDGRRGDQAPDGGQELCEVWRDRVWKLGATRASVKNLSRPDPQQPTKDLYEIWWTYRSVMRVARAALHGTL